MNTQIPNTSVREHCGYMLKIKIFKMYTTFHKEKCFLEKHLILKYPKKGIPQLEYLFKIGCL